MIPNEKRYGELVATLRTKSAEFDGAEDDKARLKIGLQALRATLYFLRGDVAVLDERLTRPLANLENALHDALQGATVPLLEHSPSRAGKPERLVREDVQGCAAATLEILVASGMGTEKAAAWIATEARRLGVRCGDGAPIVAQQIRTWRLEIRRGKAPAAACEMFERFRSDFFVPLSREPLSEHKRCYCKALAVGWIKGIATTAPRGAPKRTRRAAR